MLLFGDKVGAVNCLEPHPYLPALATRLVQSARPHRCGGGLEMLFCLQGALLRRFGCVVPPKGDAIELRFLDWQAVCPVTDVVCSRLRCLSVWCYSGLCFDIVALPGLWDSIIFSFTVWSVRNSCKCSLRLSRETAPAPARPSLHAEDVITDPIGSKSLVVKCCVLASGVPLFSVTCHEPLGRCGLPRETHYLDLGQPCHPWNCPPRWL